MWNFRGRQNGQPRGAMGTRDGNWLSGINSTLKFTSRQFTFDVLKQQRPKRKATFTLLLGFDRMYHATKNMKKVFIPLGL
jgi:hypothetical protein